MTSWKIFQGTPEKPHNGIERLPEPPNWRRFDKDGNVWEWCADHWHENYQGAPTDGSLWQHNNANQNQNPGIGSRLSNMWKNISRQKYNDNENYVRRLRGGSWYDNPADCRSANRYRYNPGLDISNIGFRVVCGGAAARTQ